MLANAVPELAEKLIAFRKRQEETVLGMTLPEVE
jgi:5-(carboxyamino)imidazole ribonucleotide mutase